eukprot:5100274-Amphidinium_carterae.1
MKALQYFVELHAEELAYVDEPAGMDASVQTDALPEVAEAATQARVRRREAASVAESATQTVVPELATTAVQATRHFSLGTPCYLVWIDGDLQLTKARVGL